MAAEETEYFSLNQGNGLSPVERPAKKGAAKKTKKTGSGNGSRLTPFLQGITVGTVLLIPVGVWCWVRADAPEAATAVEESRSPNAKSSKQAASKRKPAAARPLSRLYVGSGKTSATLPPAQIHPSRSAEPGTSTAAVDADPPQVSAPPASVPIAAVPDFHLVPNADGEEVQSADGGSKPKKNIWKTIVSPFRGKNKDRQPPASDMLPPGQ